MTNEEEDRIFLTLLKEPVYVSKSTKFHVTGAFSKITRLMYHNSPLSVESPFLVVAVLPMVSAKLTSSLVI